MICLDTFPKSLKITWVRRFYDNACKSGWKHFVIDTLPDVLHITNIPPVGKHVGKMVKSH